MRPLFLCLIVSGCLVGCGCGETELQGYADATDDPPREPPSELVPDPESDPGMEPISDPAIDTWCWDNDGDSYRDEACGGLDCDDLDPTIYPGAYDTCADGIDQDCDGRDATEGLRGENLVLLDYIHYGPVLWTKLLWTGRDYSFLWRIFMGEAVFLDHIDPGGKAVAEEVAVREYQSAYDIVWSGSGYGTAWSMGPEGSTDLYFQLLDDTGRPVMDEVRLTDSGEVATNGSTYFGPKMLSVGDDFIILFLDNRTGDHRVYFVRVANDGTRLTEDIEIAAHVPEVDGGLMTTWAGTEAGIVWNAVEYAPPMRGQFHFTRVDIEGTYLSETYELSREAAYNQEPPVIWTGSEYGIFLIQRSTEPSGDGIILSRRHLDGSESARITVFPAEEDLHFTDIRAVWTGTSFVLFWMESAPEGFGCYVQRISIEGNLIEPRINVSDVGCSELNIVWSGAELGISWVEQTDTDEGQRIRALFNRVGFCV